MSRLKVVPAKLREARDEALLSQEELAEKAGVSVANIYRLEGGEEPKGVYPRTLRRLGKALDIAPRSLCENSEARAAVG
jgi:transcriptional regulator with XRE-family HTH domain